VRDFYGAVIVDRFPHGFDRALRVAGRRLHPLHDLK
jgi:hypothetical protein